MMGPFRRRRRRRYDMPERTAALFVCVIPGKERKQRMTEHRRRKLGWFLAAAMVLSSLPLLASELPPGGSFVDDDGNVHEGFIEAIAAEGVTRGCNPPVNDRYCPGDSVTRGQMAAFLVRALRLPAAYADPFVDTQESEFVDDIAALATAGGTCGWKAPGKDRDCPDDPVTR